MLYADDGDCFAVEVGRLGRGHFFALRADNRDRQPTLLFLRAGDLLIYGADPVGAQESRGDGLVHAARKIRLARPIIFGGKARMRYGAFKIIGKIFGKIFCSRARRRNIAQRHPQVLLKLLRQVDREAVHRVEVVELIAKDVRHSPLAEHLGESAVDGNAAHGAHVDAAGERLFIADYYWLPFWRHRRRKAVLSPRRSDLPKTY